MIEEVISKMKKMTSKDESKKRIMESVNKDKKLFKDYKYKTDGNESMETDDSDSDEE